MNGQIVGYSSTESTSYGGAPGTGTGTGTQVQVQVQVHPSRIEFYDADHNRVGESSTDGMGGYNLKLEEVKSKVDVDLDGTAQLTLVRVHLRLRNTS